MPKTHLQCVETVTYNGQVLAKQGKTYPLIKDDKKETVIQSEQKKQFVVDGNINFMHCFIKK